MVRLRSTANCSNTPRVLYALEELGESYDVEVVPDGVFTAAHGIPGPELVDGDRSVFEITAQLRHVARRFGAGSLWPTDVYAQAEVDRWIDFQAVRVSKAQATRDVAGLLTLLGALDRHVAVRPWVLGDDFTIADIGFVPLLQKRAALAPQLDRHAAIGGYLDRLAARPAWARAQARAPR